MRRFLNVSAVALTPRNPPPSVSGLFHAHRMLHCRRNKLSLCHVQQGSVSQPKHVQPPTTTGDPEEEEDLTLPSHMIVKHTPHKPPSMSLEEYESRQRQTELFLNTVLEVRHTQDAIDMVCAALRLGTWKPHHAAALLRKAKRRYSDLTASTSSTKENEDDTASTTRRAPREPSVTPSSVVERLVLVVTALLEHRNRAGAWSDVISQKTLDDLFLWIAAPFVEKAKQLQQADNLVEDETVEGDEAGGAAVVGGGEEGGEQVVVDSEDLHHQEQPVLTALSSSSSLFSPSSLSARPMVYQETYGAHSTTSMLWSWCSMLELHGIGIATVLGLDALSIALRDDEALHYQSLRQSTRGAAGMSTPQRDEVRQNRLEYLDNQRARLRDAELKEELQKNSALRRGGGPAPRQALKSQS